MLSAAIFSCDFGLCRSTKWARVWGGNCSEHFAASSSQRAPRLTEAGADELCMRRCRIAVRRGMVKAGGLKSFESRARVEASRRNLQVAMTRRGAVACRDCRSGHSSLISSHISARSRSSSYDDMHTPCNTCLLKLYIFCISVWCKQAYGVQYCYGCVVLR